MPRPARSVIVSLLLSGVSFAAGSLHGQQEREPTLPATVAAAVVDFWNDPRRHRFHGPTSIPADSTSKGDIAVVDGPLDVAGRVEGSVLVVNGDVMLRPGAVVTGDLLLVGGMLEGLGGAEVRGEILRYPGRLHYRLEGDRMTREDPRAPGDPVAPDRTRQLVGGGTAPELDFLITTGNSYNRVEGMPITLGPRLRTRGANPLQVHALAIYRTESGFRLADSRIGYYLRAAQSLGGRGEWRLGATVHSVIDPIEDWHLTDLENGLATFLFHQDFRDHYEREGIGAFTAYEPAGAPISLTGEFRWETHRSLASGSPLTLFENAEPWRPQPLVAEGRLGSVRLLASYDTRSEVNDPSAGWYLRGVLEQGFHVELTRAGAFLTGGEIQDPPRTMPAQGFGRFTTGFADLRRYNRLSPDVRLNLRALVGGSLTGAPLPPQRQHAFGGEGSLPGFLLFSQDCGARQTVLRLSSDPHAPNVQAFPNYGCDAFALGQAELRGKLDFRFRLDSAPWDDDDDDAGFGWDIAPDWILFANAGTGWAFRNQPDRPDERFRADAGVGLLIDRVGIFVAIPLDGGDGANVFVRLGPRF